MGVNARAQLEKKPPLTDYETGFYLDFFELSTERQLGMAAGPIPASHIEAYSARNNLSVLQGDILRRVIRALDAAYLDAIRTKQAKAQPPAK